MTVQSSSQVLGTRVSTARASLLLLLAWVLATMSLWFFAFYSMPADVPDWVRRAQVACFGSDSSGLPGASGWMLLILSPILFLVALIIALGSEVRSGLGILHDSRLGRFMLVVLLIAIVTEVTWVAASISQRLQLVPEANTNFESARLPEAYPRSYDKAPDFKLINQNGESVTLKSLTGRPFILSFVFAHCQTVCPTLVTTISQTVAALGADELQAVLITLDPWRDTPAALPSLARKWKLGDGVHVLSGPPEEVGNVLDAYKVPRDRNNRSGDVVHPALVYVISHSGDLAYSFNNPSVAWLTEALARVRQ